MGLRSPEDPLRRLGEAFGARAQELTDTAMARALETAWEGAPPGPEYREARIQAALIANLLIARWLITGELMTEPEAAWLSLRGRAAAAEQLAIANVTRSYLAWRDVALVALRELSSELGLPPATLHEAEEGVRVSSDGAIVRMARAYDAEMERVMFQVAAERNAYRDQSARDPLTGLPNRLLLYDRLHTAVSLARRDRHLVAVILVDLDLFKEVNDNYGHAAGDEVLCRVSRRLAGQLRGSDTVARLGGDEFVIVIPRCPSPAAAREIAEKVTRVVARPISTAAGKVRVGCSVGIAHFPDDGEEPEHLLRAADLAMYSGKRLARAAR